eukprot:jgi/Mesvir1/19918/Mv13189-RA.1
MAATLVPITRPFLKKFYEGYPFQPLTPDVKKSVESLKETCTSYQRDIESSGAGPENYIAKLRILAAHKIDENLWRHREQCEEILLLLNEEKQPPRMAALPAPCLAQLASVRENVQGSLDRVVAFQKFSTTKIVAMVEEYMPKDFRGSLIAQHRERSEKKRQEEVAELVARGGSIREKYDLLWSQQMERRRTLVKLGQASGTFKVIVKYLAGVPEVLLDFVRQLNDHDGPMEEQRITYGPPLYALTELVNWVHIATHMWARAMAGGSCSTPAEASCELLASAANVYGSELARYIDHLRILFDKSPFLISAEEALKHASTPTEVVDDMKELVISRDEKIELEVEGEGIYVAWDFKVDGGKEITFSVQFQDEQGKKMPLIPDQTTSKHQGNFLSTGKGIYTLKFVNPALMSKRVCVCWGM